MSDLPATRFRVRAVVFDLDGTLIDSIPGIASSINAVRVALGLSPLAESAVRPLVGWGVEHLVAGAFPVTAGAGQAASRFHERARELYLAHYGETCGTTTRAFVGALAALRELHGRGLRLGVATNKPAAFTEQLLTGLGFRPLLDAVAGAGRGVPLKPAPDLLVLALRQLGVEPASAVYVGDMTVDVQTGSAASVPVIGVTTGSASAGELRAAGARAVVKDLGQLCGLIELAS